MKVEIVEATIEHACGLGPRLRASDAAEVRASGGFPPTLALLKSWKASDPDLRWTALVGGKPEVMFGCAGLNAEVGAAWLLASDKLCAVRREVLLYSAHYCDVMNARYRVITNWIDVRNIASLRWLERIGFQPVDFCPAWGHEWRPFLRYERRV